MGPHGRETNGGMSPKKAFFYAILASPAAALLTLVVLVAADLHAINSTDPRQVYQRLRSAYSKLKSFPMPDDISARPPGTTVVHVFGGSSLVISDGATFPAYLGLERDHLHVVNLGINGLSSALVRQRVDDALAVARPDVMVFYMGHNDYNNVYHGLVIPEYFDQFEYLIWPSYLISAALRRLAGEERQDFHWFSRMTRPRIFKLFQRMGLVDLRQEDYAIVNDFALQNFVENTNAIIAKTTALGIPVVFVTPISNLRAEPFGDLETARLYELGMRSPDYRESLRYLKAARDRGFLTYDIRAKSPLVDHVRSLSYTNVHPFDLEGLLESRGVEFGYADFLDHFHFNDRTHRIVADAIYDFLEERRLIGGASLRRLPEGPPGAAPRQ